MSPSHELSRALVRVLGSGGRRWLAFTKPTQTIVAFTLDEVIPAVAAAERAAEQGSWVVGMVSYDSAPAFDPALHALRDIRVPLVSFGVFAEAQPSAGPVGTSFEVGPWLPTVEQADYEAAIANVKEYIAAGDTYQVNYTMRLRSNFSGDPMGFFAALSLAQRADHVAYLELDGAVLCSASPELLFRQAGDHIVSKPMKGTRPRHPRDDLDEALAQELRTSAKDLAENTMIVDMVRNDLGRVAEIGSVRVPLLHSIERYPTVHQMTSTVTAKTSASLVDIMRSVFPGASITGAPKFRTSEIIAELETSPRGIYTGSIGVLAPDGRREFNIAIRTAWIDTERQTAEYGVGGGIVWDSEPTEEWNEAHHKARVLDRAQPHFRLLETMAWDPFTGAALLERHLERLRRSSDHFAFAVDIDEVRRVVEGVSAPAGQRLRILVDAVGTIELSQAPMPDPVREPWILPIDSEPVDSGDEFLFHKTTRRDRYEQAQARFPDAPDVVLINERGEITETTIGNIVCEVNGAKFTPPVESGLLAGTLRAELIDAGTVSERVITPDHLLNADRVFMINSVRGWTRIEVTANS